MKFCVFRKSACEICLGPTRSHLSVRRGPLRQPFFIHQTSDSRLPAHCQSTHFPTMLDKAKPKPQCEQLILSNISPLSESDRGENGLKFSFDSFLRCEHGSGLSIWAGLGGWLAEEQGNPEQDSKQLTPKPSRTGSSLGKLLESCGPHPRPERPPPSFQFANPRCPLEF